MTKEYVWRQNKDYVGEEPLDNLEIGSIFLYLFTTWARLGCSQCVDDANAYTKSSNKLKAGKLPLHKLLTGCLLLKYAIFVKICDYVYILDVIEGGLQNRFGGLHLVVKNETEVILS